MQNSSERISLWLKTYEKWVVIGGILATISIIFAVSLWKYSIFGYTGIDLAYFSQVFWNTVRGRFFEQSLHPHLSLGDHAEFGILLLAPLYALWQDPRTLLLLQSLALAACAWPVWRIAKFRLGASMSAATGGGVAALLPLVCAIAVLLNPTLYNIGAFEFHMLTFACFPLLMAVLAYEIGDRRRFVLWCVAALLMREDVALVVFMFGALAWIEGRAKWWRIVPAVMGAAWFVGAMAVVKHFSPAGSYKFSIYYSWLGETPLQMLTFPFRHPLQFTGHFFTLANVEMFLALLMPLALLPLLRPRRLVLALGPLAEILLGSGGGSGLIAQTHYAVLFMPALLLATIDGLGAAPETVRQRLRDLRFVNPHVLVGGTLVLCAAYGFVVLGPVPTAVWRAATERLASDRAVRYRELVERIPEDASVAASYALLPALSQRASVTSLHYIALGVTQFAERPYTPPDDIQFVALDAEDLLLYDVQFSAAPWAQPYHDGYLQRVQAHMGTPAYVNGPLALYDAKALTTSVTMPTALAVSDEPELHASLIKDGARIEIVYGLGWMKLTEGAAAHYVITDADGRTVADQRMPVDAPLPWVSRNGGTTLRYEIDMPQGRAPFTVKASIETIEGDNMLNDVLTPGLRVSDATALTSHETEVAQ